MKPKQKHKRGAARYSLDIYTPLTRDECLKRLKMGQNKLPPGDVYLSAKGNKFTARFRYNWSLTTIEFRGCFEPAVGGTHVYGSPQYHFDTSIFRNLLSMRIFTLGVNLAVLIVLVVLGAGEIVLCLLPLGYGTLIGLSFVMIRHDTVLLRWIDEQLNIEVAHETETQA
jgi:hypothetical protein